jgi:hypothetical protein
VIATPRSQMLHTAAFLEGMAVALSVNPRPTRSDPTQPNIRYTIMQTNGSDELFVAAAWLRKAAQNVCKQGYFGCNGGEDCTSDHK